MTPLRPTTHTLLTGATGFLGHWVLAELLKRGRSCAVTVRQSPGEASQRLAGLLAPHGVDAARASAAGLLVLVHGDLRGTLSTPADVRIDAVVHVAASTRFDADDSGEPDATNVEGTRRLLDWCGRAGVRSFHYVSTAFSCGRTTAEVPEAVRRDVTDFHNAYEQSKQRAELLCADWAERTGATLTVYRPSIIVGEFETGRATKFDAFYVAVRAGQVLARTVSRASPERRRAIPLRIRGRGTDPQNIVPVDYVAKLIAASVADARHHGRVYHLVNPHPPTTGQIKDAIESYFDIGGGRFVASEEFDGRRMNLHERAFHDACRAVRHYLFDTPRFARTNAERLEIASGITCPRFDEAAIHRLCRFAREADFGRKPAPVRREQPADDCAEYFERFLPQRVAASKVARMASVSATVRFVIDGADDGGWVCRFEKGALTWVLRGGLGVREDFGYRSDLPGFRRAVSGRVHPQELFLDGKAEIFGDVERALKMAMILNAFAREFPFEPGAIALPRRAPIARQGGHPCTTP